MQKRVASFFFDTAIRARGAEAVIVGSFATAPAKQAQRKEKPPPKIEKPAATKGSGNVTGYQLFLREAGLKLRSAGLPLAEISRQAAKEWAGISTDRRQKFIDEATRLNAAGPAKKQPKEKPKRVMNAYSTFVKTVWPTVTREHPDKTFVEKSRLIAKLWKNLPAEEKARRKAAAEQGA